MNRLTLMCVEYIDKYFNGSLDAFQSNLNSAFKTFLHEYDLEFLRNNLLDPSHEKKPHGLQAQWATQPFRTKMWEFIQ